MSMEQLLLIGGLALLDTLSPAILGVTIYLLLTDSRRYVQRLLVYLATVAIFYFTVGAFLMLGLGVLLENVSGILQNRMISWNILIMGGILFTASFYMPSKKNNERPLPPSNSILSMVALGFTTSLIEVGTAFPYFTAIGLMTAENLPWLEWALTLGGYNLVMVLPSLLLLLFYSTFGQWMTKPLHSLRSKMVRHTDTALSWVMCIIGLLLIFSSLDYL
ncbi:GAP family protein [Fictibacillus fluitans]|uniref:GAP family protein n=1 Tax=Fictibacillus fluitans TaxID=3058422 RepID=A0ABT8I097_9BACL|nr:GAP family protein [Fictibacillus sp. NE201]MDN4526453.1 GAP family protein [Fictibacillus sp. NE201]